MLLLISNITNTNSFSEGVGGGLDNFFLEILDEARKKWLLKSPNSTIIILITNAEFCKIKKVHSSNNFK